MKSRSTKREDSSGFLTVMFAAGLFALGIALTDCTYEPAPPTVVPSGTPSAKPSPMASGKPTTPVGQKPQATLAVTWASVSEQRIIKAALDAGLSMLNNPGCRSRILALTYDGKPGFANTDDTPPVVLARIDRAPWNVKIEVINKSFWQRWSSVTAYTTGDTIYLYRSYLINADQPELANTLIHEYQHTPGLAYSHDYYATARRNSSEPYAVGNTIEKCLRESR